MEDITVLKTGIFQTVDEVAELKIFDVNRSYANPYKTMTGIAQWLIGKARYTVTQVDMKSSPDRDDFPEWNHAGAHPEMGKLYWNWFHLSPFWKAFSKWDVGIFGSLFVLRTGRLSLKRWLIYSV